MEDPEEEKMQNNNPKTEDQNFYQILGIPIYSDISDCKKAYKVMSLQVHPDKNTNASENERKINELKFQSLQAANKILCNQKEKEIYDKKLRDGIPHAQICSLFNDFTDINKIPDTLDFIKEASGLLDDYTTQLNQALKDKDLKFFIERYTSFIQFLENFKEQINIRKQIKSVEQNEIKTLGVPIPADYQILFFNEFNENELTAACGKETLIHIGLKNKNLILQINIAVKQEETECSVNLFNSPVTLSQEDFLNWLELNNVVHARELIKKQIGWIINNVDLCDKIPSWSETQQIWMEYAMSRLAPYSEKNLELIHYNEIKKFKISQSTCLYSDPALNFGSEFGLIEDRINKLYQKFFKKFDYVSTAHRLFASEHILQKHEVKVNFFAEDEKDISYFQLGQGVHARTDTKHAIGVDINSEEAKKIKTNQLSDHFFAFIKIDEKFVLYLLIDFLVQQLDEWMKTLDPSEANSNKKNDEENDENLLLITNNDIDPSTVTTHKQNENLPLDGHTKKEGDLPKVPGDPINNKEAIEAEIANKKALLNYIYNRSFEKKYAGSFFGFKKSDKMKAARLLYSVCYLQENKEKLLQNKILLDALQQGRLGEIVKPLLEPLLREEKVTPKKLI